jgi:hypothetical protein
VCPKDETLHCGDWKGVGWVLGVGVPAPVCDTTPGMSVIGHLENKGQVRTLKYQCAGMPTSEAKRTNGTHGFADAV